MKQTFSKSIMSVMVLLYIIGFILGNILVISSLAMDIRLGNPVDSSMFVAFAAYLGAPTATAIGFYAWKSKAENVIKISKALDGTDVGVVDTLSRMEVNR